MKDLFNAYEAYTKKGGELSDELERILDPIFKKWAKAGYKVKDIEAIMVNQVSMLGAVIRMERGLATVKAKRSK